MSSKKTDVKINQKRGMFHNERIVVNSFTITMPQYLHKT